MNAYENPFGSPDDAEVPTAAPPVNRRLTLTPASRIKLRAPQWLWDTATDPDPKLAEGRIPTGALTIGAGRAGIGKSQHGVWLAAHLTRGTLPGCHLGTPRSVIYAATEDSWSMTIAPRLVAAGADLDRVFRIEVEDDHDSHARLTLPTDTGLLESAIRTHDVVLIVMDPLLSLLDATINDYRAREVREALEPLLPIADRTGCSLFGLAHFTKATGSDPLMLIAGSGAFGQLVRAGIGYARDDADDDEPTYVLSTIKSNLGRENLPSLAYRIEPAEVATDDGAAYVSRINFTGTADRSVRDLLRDSQLDDDGRSERDEAVEWLTAYLEGCGGCASAGDVIRAAGRDGISKMTLHRARKRAGIASTKGGMSSGWTWSLPTGKPDDDPPVKKPGDDPLEGTAENPEGTTPTGMGSSKPSVQPSAVIRTCNHPGDPSKRCGICIAEAGNAALPLPSGRDRCIEPGCIHLARKDGSKCSKHTFAVATNN